MPEIVVLDPSHVVIDSIQAGSITDVLANHDPDVTFSPSQNGAGFRRAFLAAIEAWVAALNQKYNEEYQRLSKTQHDALEEQANAFELERKALRAETDQVVQKAKEHYEGVLQQVQEQHAKEIEELKAKHSSVVSEHLDTNSKLKKAMVDQQAQIEALGGTELGKRLAEQQRKERLLAAKAQIDEQLKNLSENETAAFPK